MVGEGGGGVRERGELRVLVKCVLVKCMEGGEGTGVGREGVCTPILHCHGSMKGSHTQSSPL